MHGDFTRFSHQPRRGYAGVLMQQGRVTLDADWNEQSEIDDHRLRVQTVDTIGRACAPEGDAGFSVSLTPDGTDLLIGAGRIYVDGLLVELAHGPWLDAERLDADGEHARVWVRDPGGEELSGGAAGTTPLDAGHWVELDLPGVEERTLARVEESPQPGDDDVVIVPVRLFGTLPDGAVDGARVRRLVTYRTQPFFPADDPDLGEPLDPDAWTGQRHLVYLDVWRRHVTAAEDPAIREVALGGPDTATRVQVVWAVRILTEEGRPADASDIGCQDPFEAWDALTAPGGGRLSARAEATADPEDPCAVTPEAGYRGVENRLYRVEVHEPGPLGLANFKWSRDNGSVVTRITGFPEANTVRVENLGRDRTLQFRAGDRVEVVSEQTELSGTPGTLATVEGEPHEGERTIALDADVRAIHEGQRGLRLRRWDHPDSEPHTRTDWTTLEKGVQVAFAGHPTSSDAYFRTGEYWVIPARVATGDVEGFTEAPPRGIDHHYARLALVAWPNGEAGEAGARTVVDCRRTFPSLCHLPTGGGDGCATVTVGDGVTSVGDVNDLQAAVDALPADRPAQISVLPGTHTLHEPVEVRRSQLTIVGCGRATRLIAPQQPALRLLGCSDVQLRDLTIEAMTHEGAVLVERCREVLVQGCTVLNARRPDEPGQGADPTPARWATLVPQISAGLTAVGPAIAGGHSALVWLVDNVLVGQPAVTLQTHGLTVADNVARGTLRVRDGSSNVAVRGNDVVGGHGPGVAIGGLAPEESLSGTGTGVRTTRISANRVVGMTGSAITTLAPPPDEAELAVALRAELARYERGGGADAGAVRFDREREAVAAGRYVTASGAEGAEARQGAAAAVGDVADVTIADNVLADCGTLGVDDRFEPDAVGGVVLRDAVGVRIHGNEITGNGAPRGCGIYLHGCEAVDVHGNALADNGGPQGEYVDFTLSSGERLPGPVFTRDGFRFELIDADVGAVWPLFGLGMPPGGLTVTLPGPTDGVELTLGAFVPGTVRAFDGEDGEGEEVATRSYPADGLRRVTLAAPAGQIIRSLRIEPGGWQGAGASAASEQLETLGAGFLLAICAGTVCRSYQGGIVAVAVSPDADTPAGWAIRLHDNTVSAPAGQALLVIGVGTMTVADNHLETLAHVLQSSAVADVLGEGLPDPWLPRTVYIASAGRAGEFGNRVGLTGQKEANVAPSKTPPPREREPDGRIAFHANQVVHRPAAGPPGHHGPGPTEMVLASAGLSTHDDLVVAGNQFAMDTPQIAAAVDALALGVTTRASDNRWAETPDRVAFSAAVVGIWLAQATGNQATHCLLVSGADTRADNQVLQELIDKQPCSEAGFDLGSGFGAMFRPQGGQ